MVRLAHVFGKSPCLDAGHCGFNATHERSLNCMYSALISPSKLTRCRLIPRDAYGVLMTVRPVFLFFPLFPFASFVPALRVN